MLRTQDGEHWEKLTVPAARRSTSATSKRSASGPSSLMSAGPGDASRIYRITDGGATWKLVHTNPDKDGFYDAIAFWDAKNGVVIGDPVNGRFVVRVTDDGGRDLGDAPEASSCREALTGEGAFAASGTCLFVVKGGHGRVVRHRRREGRARLPHERPRPQPGTAATTPAPAGNASSGLFSVAFLDAKRGFAAGGDYKQPAFAGLERHPHRGRRRHLDSGAASRRPASTPPSSRPGNAQDELVAVGLAGEAVSHDAGRTWTRAGDVP